MVKKKRKLNAFARFVKANKGKGKSIKQLGVEYRAGKRATQVRRAPSRSRSSPNRRRPRRTNTMAKRKRTRRRSPTMSPTKLAAGAVVFSFAEPFVDRLAGNFGVGLPDEVVKIGLGVLAMKKGKGSLIKGAGAAAIIIGINRLTTGGLGIATGAPAVGVGLRRTVI